MERRLYVFWTTFWRLERSWPRCARKISSLVLFNVLESLEETFLLAHCRHRIVVLVEFSDHPCSSWGSAQAFTVGLVAQESFVPTPHKKPRNKVESESDDARREKDAHLT